MWVLFAAADAPALPAPAAAPAGEAAPSPGALLSPQPASRPVAAAPAARVMPPVRIALLPESGIPDASAAWSIDFRLLSVMFVLSHMEMDPCATVVHDPASVAAD